MTVTILGDQPEITTWLQRRQALGQDRYDEMWEGNYHVAPMARLEHAYVITEIMLALGEPARQAGLYGTDGFNLGSETDYRVPDAGWHSERPSGVYAPTAVAVLEVLSPDDETFHKFDFYTQHQVREILVAHPTEHWVRGWQLNPRTVSGNKIGNREIARSEVFGMELALLQSLVRW